MYCLLVIVLVLLRGVVHVDGPGRACSYKHTHPHTNAALVKMLISVDDCLYLFIVACTFGIHKCPETGFAELAVDTEATYD